MIDEMPLNHGDGPDALKPCSKTDSFSLKILLVRYWITMAKEIANTEELGVKGDFQGIRSHFQRQIRLTLK